MADRTGVVVTHYGSIGDQMLSIPALIGLKRKWGRITLICSPKPLYGTENPKPSDLSLLDNLGLIDKYVLINPETGREKRLDRLAMGVFPVWESWGEPKKTMMEGLLALNNSLNEVRKKDAASYDARMVEWFTDRILAIEEREREALLMALGDINFEHNLNFHGTAVGPIVWRKGTPDYNYCSEHPGEPNTPMITASMDTSYIDEYIKRAEVGELITDDEKRPQFRLTEEEKHWNKEFRIAHGIGPRDVVVWYQVNGSGTNKIFYHADSVLVSLLHHYPRLHIILGGDEAARKGVAPVLEQWKNHRIGREITPRLHNCCMSYGLRRSAALLDTCDLYIGPDTGFFHISQGLGKPAVLILAHTLPHLCAKYYKDVLPVQSQIKCSPCHRIIDENYCPDHKGEPIAPCMQEPAIKATWILNRAAGYIEQAFLNKKGNLHVSQNKIIAPAFDSQHQFGYGVTLGGNH